jgi:hypothetical protein
MATRVHMSISIRGMLNWDRKYTKRMMKSITKDDGSQFGSVEEFRNFLFDELAKGHEVLPMSKECERVRLQEGMPRP